MLSILALLDKYLFSGVPSNLVYDLIKTAWEKANNKTWEQLFFEAFHEALKDMQPYFSKYGDGVIEFDIPILEKALTQDLHLTINEINLYKLSTEKFSTELASYLRKRQALIIGGHNLSEADYEQLIYRLVKSAESLFKKSILNNDDAFKKELLSESHNNFLEIEKLQDYLRLHHDVVIGGFETVKEMLESQDSRINEIHSDIQSIKNALGIDKTRTRILEEIQLSTTQILNTSVFTAGLCKGYILNPHPNQYFLAQEFSSNSEDLRGALSDALQEFSMRPIRADDIFESGHLLCKISGLIQSTPFGIYQLTKSQNRNVYLELGIALGLGKPFILIKDKNATAAPIVDGIEYLPINHYLDLKYNLSTKLEPFITNIANHASVPTSSIKENSSVIISHGDIDTIDFVVPIAKIISDLGFKPVILGKPVEELSKYLELEKVENYEIVGDMTGGRLDESITAIRSARYGVYRIEKDCSPDAFIYLGIAIGGNCPGTLVHPETAELPSDLKGLSTVSFKSYTNLTDILSGNLKRNTS